MTGVAFSLVLASAVSHASWNFLLKRSDHKVAFLWSLSVVSFALFLVPAGIFAYTHDIGWRGVMFGLVSAALHGLYGLALSRSYQLGDLSVVYPIARGMGPALIPVVAILLLGESISAWGATGIALVVIGVLFIQLQSLRPANIIQPLQNMDKPATTIAVLTNVLITTYSL